MRKDETEDLWTLKIWECECNECAFDTSFIYIIQFDHHDHYKSSAFNNKRTKTLDGKGTDLIDIALGFDIKLNKYYLSFVLILQSQNEFLAQGFEVAYLYTILHQNYVLLLKNLFRDVPEQRNTIFQLLIFYLTLNEKLSLILSDIRVYFSVTISWASSKKTSSIAED